MSFSNSIRASSSAPRAETLIKTENRATARAFLIVLRREDGGRQETGCSCWWRGNRSLSVSKPGHYGNSIDQTDRRSLGQFLRAGSPAGFLLRLIFRWGGSRVTGHIRLRSDRLGSDWRRDVDLRKVKLPLGGAGLFFFVVILRREELRNGFSVHRLVVVRLVRHQLVFVLFVVAQFAFVKIVFVG